MPDPETEKRLTALERSLAQQAATNELQRQMLKDIAARLNHNVHVVEAKSDRQMILIAIFGGLLFLALLGIQVNNNVISFDLPVEVVGVICSAVGGLAYWWAQYKTGKTVEPPPPPPHT